MALLPSTPLAAILVSASLLLCTNAQFAIPPRYDGISLSGPTTQSPILLEAFFDLMCPSCLQAWPAIKEVTSIYDKRVLQLIVHPFPVPFHHSANIAARGMHIAASVNSSLAYSWMEAVYKHQHELSDYNTRSLSYVEVVEQFAELATEIGIEKSTFLAGYDDSRTDLATRVSFKFGCSRAVVGTPTFAVNGVTVQGADESWTVRDWKALLNPLVGFGNSVQEI